MRRSLIERIDLRPCYTVTDDGGTCWIVRCRHCSAGWLPDKTSLAGLPPLLWHARRKHKLRLARIPKAAPLLNGQLPPYIASMPIQIPADAKTVQEKRLTLIRTICTLHDRLVEGDAGLKAQVKTAMQAKGAEYAESDFVVAALRAGNPKGTIDARKLYKLVDAGMITLSQFLECVAVVKKPLEKFLGADAIKKMTTFGPASDPSLTTEFKEGVELDLDQLGELLTGAITRVVPIKAA